MTTIMINEANYVDPRAGNDKFYRVFTIGSFWVTQYGRNGTLGTFTKLIEAGSPEAAQKAAEAKFSSKVKKGYNPVRTGTVTTTTAITAENLTLLDELADTLPLGATLTIVSEPINAVDLGQQQKPDLTDTVATSLLAEEFDSTPTIPTDLHPTMMVRPMLASIQPAEQIGAAMDDATWFAQYKYDGDRVVIEVNNGEIRVLNRQGEEKTKNIGSAHLLPLSALHSGRWVFDGEVVGRTLVLFDVAAAADNKNAWVREHSPFFERYSALKFISTVLGIPLSTLAKPDDAVVLAPIATSQEEKVQFLTTAIAEQREGIILRHKLGPYEHGRRSTTLIKHKLIKDADVIVINLHDTKQSTTLAVHGSEGTLIEIGAASTIGKGDVAIGDVWVVTFLYVTNPLHPRLFQPRLVNKRDDKLAADCTIDQFADAGTSKII